MKTYYLIQYLYLIQIITSYRPNSQRFLNLKSDFESSWKPSQVSECKVSLSQFQWVCGTLRGLKSISPLKQNKLFITLKKKDCLSASELCPDDKLSKLWPEIGGNTRLSMILLQKWINLGRNGDFMDNYIKSLPTPGTLGTPIHWNIEKLRNNPYRYLYRYVTVLLGS